MNEISDLLKNSPFPTGSSARAVVDELNTVFDSRAGRLAKIKDMYDRKPPYDPAKLAEAGQSYRANVNTGEMESLIDDETAEATLSIMSAVPVASFKSPDTSLLARIKLASAYHDFLHTAKSFSLFRFVDKVHFEANAYGFGAAIFPHTSDWRPAWQPHFEVRFDSHATPEPGEMDQFAVHTRISLSKLFEELEFDPDAVADGWHKGWNVSELRRFLVEQINGLGDDKGDRNYTNEYLEAAQALRDGTGWAASSTRFRRVMLTHLYASHPKTAKVAHYILAESPPAKTETQAYTAPQSMPQSSPDTTILYFKPDEYEKMEHAVWVMSYHLGPSTLASVRGLAHRAYLHTDLSNRFFSATMDGAFISASLILQTPESDTHGRIPIVRAGPITAMPAGWSPIQSSFTPNFPHLISLRETSAAIMHNNLGTYRRRPESVEAMRRDKSAAEVQNEASQESEAKQNRATYRMVQWNALHQEIFRRVSSKTYLGGLDVDEFTKIAIDAGMDEDKVFTAMGGSMPEYRKDVIRFYLRVLREDLPLSIVFDLTWDVTAYRGYGAGSRQSRVQALQELLSIAAGLPRDRTDRLRHAYVIERTGNTDLADEMFPVEQGGESREVLWVTLENNDMKEGRQIPVPVDVDHVVHFTSHIQLFFADIKAWQEDPNEGNTRELYALWNSLVPHAARHLEFISMDPVTAGQLPQLKPMFEQLIAVGQQIANVAENAVQRNQENRDALAGEIQQLRTAANKTQGELQLKAQALQGQMQIDMAKTENLNRNRDAKTQTQLQTRGISWQQDEMRKMQSHQLEMQRQLDKIMAEREKLQLENDKLRQQVRTPNAPE